jgi:hypothetical protein
VCLYILTLAWIDFLLFRKILNTMIYSINRRVLIGRNRKLSSILKYINTLWSEHIRLPKVYYFKFEKSLIVIRASNSVQKLLVLGKTWVKFLYDNKTFRS